MDPEEPFAASLLGFLSGARASNQPRRSTGPQRKPRIAIEKNEEQGKSKNKQELLGQFSSTVEQKLYH